LKLDRRERLQLGRFFSFDRTYEELKPLNKHDPLCP